MEIKGTHNTAVVFTDDVEETAAVQIRALCDDPGFAGSRIRVMPDVHAGKGCVVGLTMTLDGAVDPDMVGVDIGCGMLTVPLGVREADFARLDEVIRLHVPSGFDARTVTHPLADAAGLERLTCRHAVDQRLARRSVGTLGGGNHFIEIDRSGGGALFLVIHSGSRKLGLQTAAFHSRKAREQAARESRQARKAAASRLREAGREAEIPAALKATEARPAIPRVSGRDFDDYISDMTIVQRFASLNRRAMAQVICEGMGWPDLDYFETVHNYVDTETMTLRKGAVSAREGETLLIPLNMRDGSLLCRGRGNPGWNSSAPHGAGRAMSRTAARKTLSVEGFLRDMEGIYTTSAGPDTLDEAPGAYKDAEAVTAAMAPSVTVVQRLLPVYSFKAGSPPRKGRERP
jgi:RNA-splicing ligase RtcB